MVSAPVYEKSVEMCVCMCVLSGAHRMSQVYQNLKIKEWHQRVFSESTSGLWGIIRNPH